MRLYPLDKRTGVTAQYHADIHLRPCVVFIAKILSDACHLVLGEIIQKEINDKGERTYTVPYTVPNVRANIHLLPPSGNKSVWSRWAAKSRANSWYLVDLAYALSTEYSYRFKVAVPEYSKIQAWVMNGIIQLFPQQGNDLSPEEFPVDLPTEEVLKLGNEVIQKGVVDIYRAFYANQNGKVRMRWTLRPSPAFIYGLPEANAQGQLALPAPK